MPPKLDVEHRIRSAVERWVERDRRCRSLHRAVRAAEKDLRSAVPKEAWVLYLALEEQMNARHIEIVSAAIRITRATTTTKRRVGR